MASGTLDADALIPRFTVASHEAAKLASDANP